MKALTTAGSSVCSGAGVFNPLPLPLPPLSGKGVAGLAPEALLLLVALEGAGVRGVAISLASSWHTTAENTYSTVCTP